MRLLENRAILVVEDSEIFRKAIAKMTASLGAKEIFRAGNGATALKFIKEKKIDLILSDWEMPLLNGLHLLRMIRSDKNLEDSKFIMLTSACEKDAVLTAAKEGVNDYIIKPVRIETLAEKIKGCLSSAHGLKMDLYHLDIGDYCKEEQDLDVAIRHFHKALEYNPANSRVHLSLGEAHYQKGNLSKALSSLTESIRINNQCARAHFSKSLVHVGLRQPTAAEKEFQVAIELDPEDLKRCEEVADAFLKHGYVDQATSALKVALELDPHDAILYNKIGITLRKNGRAAEAIEQYNKALRIIPDEPVLLFNLSKAYLANQNRALARETLRKLLDLAPDFPEAEELLSKL